MVRSSSSTSPWASNTYLLSYCSRSARMRRASVEESPPPAVQFPGVVIAALTVEESPGEGFLPILQPSGEFAVGGKDLALLQVSGLGFRTERDDHPSAVQYFNGCGGRLDPGAK